MCITVNHNFLDRTDFDKIHSLLTSAEFPYFFQNWMAYVGEDSGEDMMYFSHSIIDGCELKTSQEFFNIIARPILSKLNFTKFYNMGVNFNVDRGKPIISNWHTDFPPTDLYKNNKTAILYISTNNGYTEFKNGTISASEENKLIIFDNALEHRAVTQTDKKYRIVINLNYM